jgi:acyl-CoA dehydrogenase
VHSTICALHLHFGTDEQKSRWLPRVTGGEAVLAIAMTEPGTGSDLQAVRTTAVRDGDDYVVNGSKTFISNPTPCDLLIIVAKTDPSQGAKGISVLVAETNDLPRTRPGAEAAFTGSPVAVI